MLTHSGDFVMPARLGIDTPQNGGYLSLISSTANPQEGPMFQRYAVTFTTSAQPNECFTTSLVDLDEGDARETVARQIACRHFGRAEMADHVEVDLTPIGQPTLHP